MRYRFFICKPMKRCNHLLSRALRAYLEDGGHHIDREDLLLPFDVARLSKLLCIASGESAGLSPRFKFRQVGGVPLLAVWTEYRKAQDVADSLAICIGDDGVTLFDGEMECSANIEKWERTKFVKTQLACQRLKMALQKNPALTAGCCARAVYFNLGQCFYPIGIVDVAVMILKGEFRAAVTAVDETLRFSLAKNESLSCDCGCFVVANDAVGYKIRFVVEGLGKSAQYMGWVVDGSVHLELLHRESLYKTIKNIVKAGDGEMQYVRSRLYFREAFDTRGEMRNPADRFVDSYKISTWLKRYGIDVIYGRHPKRSHNEFVFYASDGHCSGWDSWKTSSFFTTTEEQAVPLLAVFESVIPYYYEYYYDTFHFRKEEVKLILARIEVVRRQVIIDPCDPTLGKISQRLQHSDFALLRQDGKAANGINEAERRAILVENRFRIVAFLNFFSRWLSDLRDEGFYVQGP